MKSLTELEFYKCFIIYHDEGGHTYHGNDIFWAWKNYQTNPEKWVFLQELKDNIRI